MRYLSDLYNKHYKHENSPETQLKGEPQKITHRLIGILLTDTCIGNSMDK